MFDDKDFANLLRYMNKVFDSNFVTIPEYSKKVFNNLIKKGKTKAEIKRAIDNCKNDEWHKEHNYKFIRPDYFASEKTLDMYGKKVVKEDSMQKYHDLNNGKHRNI